MSTVVLDTITGKSTATTITIGSTPVVSASANSMTIRGEGTAQTSIQQGLCKAWTMSETLAGSTTAVPDSLNVSSETDYGTGECVVNFANDYANLGYTCHTTAANNGDVFNTTKHASTVGSDRTYLFRQSSGAVVDNAFSMTTHGDLA